MNYIGSKYSLMSFLEKSIEEVTKNKAGGIFADLFAGTGVVGTRYRRKGYEVLANDIQYYSYILNRHYIENSYIEDGELLNYLNSLSLVEEGFIYNNYCLGSGSLRNYFTDYNGKKCDTIRMELERLRKNNEISEDIYFYYLASLINSIDKYANTASVYGAFLKHTKKSALKNFNLELLPIINGIKGKVYNEDINKVLERVNGDILYLDPPYNSRQYSSNYHVLETIARYDNPRIKGKTGLRVLDSEKSKFCSKRMVVDEFEITIRKADFKYIFLSYNNEGLMDLEKIKDIMSGLGEYRLFTKEYRRFKADKDENRNIVTDRTTEYLHCLIKK